jgi:hypothetical protein
MLSYRVQVADSLHATQLNASLLQSSMRDCSTNVFMMLPLPGGAIDRGCLTAAQNSVIGPTERQSGACMNAIEDRQPLYCTKYRCTAI